MKLLHKTECRGVFTDVRMSKTLLKEIARELHHIIYCIQQNTFAFERQKEHCVFDFSK